MMVVMPKSYHGLPLSMKLPLQVIGDPDCVHICDAGDNFIIEGMTNATDAHYIVDAVNEYTIVMEAKCDAFAEVRKFVAALGLDQVAEFCRKKINDNGGAA